jgi:hypothetical protein
MKFYISLLLLALAGGAGLAQITEPPEYPDNVSCSPAGDTSGGVVINRDHPCHCKPVDHDPMCEGTHRQMGSECNQWCWEKHCSCPTMSCDPQQPSPDTEE